MTKHVQCPHCGQAYALTAEQLPRFTGHDINCTQCDGSFVVSAEIAVTGGLTTAPTVFETMPTATAGAYAPAALAGDSVDQFSFADSSPASSSRGDRAQAASNGFASASLIFALLGLVVPVLPGMLAIILGFAGLKRARHARLGAGLSLSGVVLGLIGMILTGGILLNYGGALHNYLDELRNGVVPRLTSVSPISNESRCASNLHALAVAMQQYAMDNAGHYPDRVESIVESQHLRGELLICPSTHDTAVEGETSQERAENLANGAHVSYIYVGGELTTESPSECVLLYEPIGRHGEGMQVLFCDGHVEVIAKAEAERAVDRLAAGENPPWTRPR